MSRDDPRRNTARYRRMRAEFMRKQGRWGICSLCQGNVDMSLSGMHLQGPTLDHRRPASQGGEFWDENNWALAHRRCNIQKLNRLPELGPVDGGSFGYKPGDQGICWYRSYGMWTFFLSSHNEPGYEQCQLPPGKCWHPKPANKGGR